MTITLYQFPRGYGLPNASPFCMKLESYFRAMNIDYQIEKTFDPRKSPTGKIPYVKMDKKLFSDSQLIIDKFEEQSDHPMQGVLNAQEKVQTLALMRLLEEHLYWAIVYSRWVDDVGYAVFKEGLQKAIGMPAFMFNLIVKRIRKDVIKQLHGHGLGRHKLERVYAFGMQDIDAVATFLGNQSYCFHDRPTLLDHCLYSHILSITHMPWEFELKKHVLEKENLRAHGQRMMAQFFPELVNDNDTGVRP